MRFNGHRIFLQLPHLLCNVFLQLPHLLSGTVAPSSWLDLVEVALLALDLAPDTQLLQAIIQVGVRGYFN